MLRVWWSKALIPGAMLAESLARIDPGNVALSKRACKVASICGDAARTRRIARHALRALSRSSAVLEQNVGAREAQRRPGRAIDEDRALMALADTYGALSGTAIRPFVIFGTLLGAIRQQGFIPGDSDVDLGIIGPDRLRGLRSRLKAAGFAVSPVRRSFGYPVKVKVKHPNGCALDVKLFDVEPDGAVTWYSNMGNLVFMKRFPGGFGLAEADFLGVRVNVPDRAEEFLEWQYGPGWRTPDPTYHMKTSGPIHGSYHLEFTRTAGPAEILRTLAAGKREKACGMARNMGALFADDDLWPQLVSALAGDRFDAPPPGPDGSGSVR